MRAGIAIDAGRDQAVRGLFAEGGDVAGQNVAINRQRQRAPQVCRCAQFGIAEIDAEEKTAEIRPDPQLVTEAFTQPIQSARWHRFGQIKIAGLESLQFAGGIFGDDEAHVLDGHFAGVMKMRIALQGDGRVRLPVDKTVSAIADQVAGSRMRIAVLGNRWQIHRHRDRQGQQFQQRCRSQQGDPKAARIDHGDAADRTGTGCHRIGADDGRQHRRQWCRGVPAECAVECGDDGVGIDRHAVRPFQIGAQKKRVDQAIVGHRPALGHAGHDAALGILADQTFVQITQDVLAGDVLRTLHVQCRWFRAIATTQHAIIATGSADAVHRHHQQQRQPLIPHQPFSTPVFRRD